MASDLTLSATGAGAMSGDPRFGPATNASERELLDASPRIASTVELAEVFRIGADGPDVTPRWVLVHMIDEYAHHLGHADILRQEIDGTVGE
ncbi:MAG: DUF664 domain-containing protein [Acidimicrobiales bacterium]